MKPCRGCPFLPSSPLGLWDPAHYLLIAYLGSVRDYVEGVLSFRMGCHKGNSTLQGESRTCAGWERAARDSFALTIRVRFGHPEAPDDCEVLSPEDMARLNGLDVDRLPPLAWERKRYPRFTDWQEEVLALRRRLEESPQAAREYIVPGSPLDRGVDPRDIEHALGRAAAARYRRGGAARVTVRGRSLSG